MLQVFIDANIYLRFFAYSTDALDELEKFRALCEAKKIKLFLTDQVKREIARNRDAEVSRALGRFEKSFSSPEIPRFAANFDETVAVYEAAKALTAAKSSLREKLDAYIDSNSLPADDLVNQLELVSELLVADDHDFMAARDRRDFGDPPGKRDSLGDQLNWEMLLDQAATNSDLHIITQDGDFFSKLDKDLPDRALVNEWHDEKSADLFIYRSLGEFAKKHFPEIKLPSDVFRTEWVSRLAKTRSFSTTHTYVEKLQGIFDDLTLEDAVRLFQAMIENEQINWISEDEDVKEFFLKLYDKFGYETSGELDKQLYEAVDYLGIPF
ncbi:PIN domain-containing protein [Erythrobacter sp. F6033]|uniref:PIN domain-containing protein n=1 Tax=Erythrobacter sp. F6033 TaxID=2926401 RepID=UPI001FF283A8|nr:PIN domain-containing protein [Erythrobacter sp. F6033]MCK0129493.1 PIN domain-containing protein [Erythrobacter sp. F6033]